LLLFIVYLLNRFSAHNQFEIAETIAKIEQSNAPFHEKKQQLLFALFDYRRVSFFSPLPSFLSSSLFPPTSPICPITHFFLLHLFYVLIFFVVVIQEIFCYFMWFLYGNYYLFWHEYFVSALSLSLSSSLSLLSPSLHKQINDQKKKSRAAQVSEFDAEGFLYDAGSAGSLQKLGSGSLGGKGHGLAFLNSVVETHHIG
jgi:hypothetical protein